VRPLALIALAACAVAHWMYLRLIIPPNGASIARARARWLHRWCRAARWVLGMRNHQRGFAPVSGIVAARHGSVLDAVMLAAIQPCVFVAGSGVRRLPLVGFLARLGGTIFLDGPARRSLPFANFQIQRAVRRRLIVVIFPERGDGDPSELKTFASGLFEPAVELGCTLTAAAIEYRDVREGECPAPGIRTGASVLKQAMRIVTRPSCRSTLSFSAPTLLRGNRKQLALMLLGKMLALMLNIGANAVPSSKDVSGD
jgi:hypothetical protein